MCITVHDFARIINPIRHKLVHNSLLIRHNTIHWTTFRDPHFRGSYPRALCPLRVFNTLGLIITVLTILASSGSECNKISGRYGVDLSLVA